MEQVILLLGGIGDFLQCLPFIDANKKDKPYKYACVTHLKGAKEFFDTVGINPDPMHIFSTLDEQNAILNNLNKNIQWVHCPRAQYFPEFPFDLEKPVFTNGKPVVGVHINGSAFSIDTQKKFGMILKSIPARLIKELISPDYNLMVFGLEEELTSIGLKESDNLVIISHKNPTKSLTYVAQCNALVGSDSAFKTISSMNNIPTFVWMGDYSDPPRDQAFIDPYVKDGVMKVFRYKDVDAQFERGITMTKEFLNEVL
jgi:hypothetical protein